jgi:hypothetical protein
MPRIGQNPLKPNKAPSFIRDIVFVVVTHFPEPIGYHAERFEIVKSCLYSMRKRSKRTHSFYVFDNGSHDMFREWVYNEFKPEMLTFSKNIGKAAARTTAIASLPPETLVSYSDDDILFYDNWLNPQIELLTNFPNVSLVSGYPIRTMFRWGNKNTLLWATKNAKVEVGRFMPDEWEKDYAESVGKNYDDHIKNTEKDNDIKITFDNHEAYATAHHAQFTGYVGKLLRLMTYDTMALGDEKNFDIKADLIGLRLSTIERQCRHMGNHIDEKLQSELDTLWQKQLEKSVAQ